MITPEKIEDWIHEVEARPESAALILRFVANRLTELAIRNEELLAENIELRSGRKAEEYENRIASLEYQLDLLKRQFGSGAPLAAAAPAVETTSLLIYTAQGQVLRVEFRPDELASDSTVARFRGPAAPAGQTLRMFAASSQEELLFVFDSGRTVTMPAERIPAAANAAAAANAPAAANAAILDWQQAFLEEPRGGEELVTIVPVATMSLYEFCIQASRRGFVKKLRETVFETHIANHYIGTGVKSQPDKTCSLTFCGKDDQLVLASKEGFLTPLAVNALPFAIEQGARLGQSDHIVTAFVKGQKPSLLVITQNGKAIHREAGWLETATSFKSKGQAVFSKEKRLAGVQVVAAAAVDEDDWGLALDSTGQVLAYRIADLFSAGSFSAPEAISGQQSAVTILGFTVL